MPAIYSVLLGRGNQGAAGIFPVFTAPAVGVIVVRSIALLLYNGTTAGQIYSTAGAALAYLNGVGGTTTYQLYNGRWVLTPSDQINIQLVGGGGQWFISGYDLSP